MALVLVRGAGDVGSAVAHALFARRHRVVLHDDPVPSHPRRGMSFTDALYRGKSELEGTLGKHARTISDLALMVQCGHAIPVTDIPFEDALSTLHPDVLVDARMRKHSQPESQRGFAPLTVGLGPNFVAGETTDVVVETAWGPNLGEVLRVGRALDLVGEPRAIAGHGRERFVYSPVAGRFRTRFDIGAMVGAGEQVGSIGDTPLYAPLSGCLRGLAQDGAWVEVNAKVIEVDPRSSKASVHGLGERPKKIAHAVLRVIADSEASSTKSRNPQP